MARSSSAKLKAYVVKMKITLGDISDRKIGVETGVMLLKNQLSNVGLALAECGSLNQMNLLAEFSSELYKIDNLLVDNREDMYFNKRPSNEIQDLRRELVKLAENDLFRSVGVA